MSSLLLVTQISVGIRKTLSEELLIHDDEHNDVEDDDAKRGWIIVSSVDDRSIFSILFFYDERRLLGFKGENPKISGSHGEREKNIITSL